MRECTVLVTTTIDGQETRIQRAGWIDRTDGKILLRYKEATATTEMSFAKGAVRLSRRGDYELTLQLKENAQSVGELGFGGNRGELEVTTKGIEYRWQDGTFEARLRYLIGLGEDAQDTYVVVQAFFKGEI